MLYVKGLLSLILLSYCCAYAMEEEQSFEDVPQETNNKRMSIPRKFLDKLDGLSIENDDKTGTIKEEIAQLKKDIKNVCKHHRFLYVLTIAEFIGLCAVIIQKINIKKVRGIWQHWRMNDHDTKSISRNIDGSLSQSA